MTSSESHHYVPVFLLKKWCKENDNKLWYYKKIAGKLIESRISPKGTAFEPDLNSLKKADSPFSNVTEDNVTFVERKLAEIDSAASIAMHKIINTGINSLSFDEKVDWLNFVFLLFERNPERIAEVETKTEEIFENVIDNSIERFGNAQQWNQTADLLRKTYFTHNQVRVRLHDIIKNRAILEKAKMFEWRIADLSRCPLELFTSNIPLIANMKYKYEENIQFIEMALSPKHLWFCARDGFEFDDELIKSLTISYNMRLMSLHPTYVYSMNQIIDEKHMKYKKALNDFLSEIQ